MSRLAMDGQKPELYNEPFGVIRAMNREDVDEIAEECKRRDIRHYYDTSQDTVVDWPADGYEIEIRETGLKALELIGWVTARFNVEEEEEEDLYTCEGLVMRDEHQAEWYNENLVVIYAMYRRDSDEIAKECKRRGIRHTHYPDKIEVLRGGALAIFHTVKIEEKGPKVRKLAGWAIRKFNTEERLKTEEGMNVKNVWIKRQEEN